MRLIKKDSIAPSLVQEREIDEKLKQAFDSIDATIRDAKRVREKAVALKEWAENLQQSAH